jgi:hypothetical protein
VSICRISGSPHQAFVLDLRSDAPNPLDIIFRGTIPNIFYPSIGLDWLSIPERIGRPIF